VATFGDVVVPTNFASSQILDAPNSPKTLTPLSSLTVHLTASTLKKFSCHLIFHIPNCIWVDNENLGAFIKEFIELWDDEEVGKRWGWGGNFWLEEEEKENEGGTGLTQNLTATQLAPQAKATKSIVDTAIYTRNRVFRILGSTKYGKKGGEGRLKVWDRKGWEWGDNFWEEFGEGGDIKVRIASVQCGWGGSAVVPMMGITIFFMYSEECQRSNFPHPSPHPIPPPLSLTSHSSPPDIRAFEPRVSRPANESPSLHRPLLYLLRSQFRAHPRSPSKQRIHQGEIRQGSGRMSRTSTNDNGASSFSSPSLLTSAERSLMDWREGNRLRLELLLRE